MLLLNEDKIVASGFELGNTLMATLKSVDARTGMGTEGTTFFAAMGAASEIDVLSKLEDKGDDGDDEN